jgi:hypothetical protein
MTGDGTMARVAGPSVTRSKVLKVGMLAVLASLVVEKTEPTVNKPKANAQALPAMTTNRGKR